MPNAKDSSKSSRKIEKWLQLMKEYREVQRMCRTPTSRHDLLIVLESEGDSPSEKPTPSKILFDLNDPKRYNVSVPDE
jgi:hypothetical protein